MKTILFIPESIDLNQHEYILWMTYDTIVYLMKAGEGTLLNFYLLESR
jgi:hypothetical protein